MNNPYVLRIPEELLSQSKVSMALLDLADALRSIQTGRLRVTAQMGHKFEDCDLDSIADGIYGVIGWALSSEPKEPF